MNGKTDSHFIDFNIRICLYSSIAPVKTRVCSVREKDKRII